MQLRPQIHTVNNNQSASLVRFVELSFIEACSFEEPSPSPIMRGTWIMMVAVNSRGVRVGVTIKSPSGQYGESKSIRLNYALSNNKAEYDALILGLQWALEVDIEAMEVLSDSHVIVRQVNCEYSVNSNNLKVYAGKVDHLVSQL